MTHTGWPGQIIPDVFLVFLAGDLLDDRPQHEIARAAVLLSGSRIEEQRFRADHRQHLFERAGKPDLAMEFGYLPEIRNSRGV